MKKYKTVQVIRLLVLAASIVFTLFLSSFISQHAICPIGGFELFFTGLFRTGFTLAGLFSGMTITFIVMSVLSIIFRRAFCGYMCPMGAVQEFMGLIGRRVLPKKLRGIKVPAKTEKVLRLIKYPVLASFVILAGVIGGHWMIHADPFIALMNSGVRGGVAAGIVAMPLSFLFLGLILVAAFFIDRAFCRYLCPAGAWYAILSKASASHMVRDENACVGCGLCTKECPMNIDVAHLKTVRSAECIGCRRCESVCPKDALSYTLGDGKIPKVLIPAAAAALFAGSVTVSSTIMPKRAGTGGGNGEHNGQGGGEGRGYGNKTAGSDQSQAQGAGYTAASAEQKAALAKIGGCGDCNACGFCTGVLQILSEKV